MKPGPKWRRSVVNCRVVMTRAFGQTISVRELTLLERIADFFGLLR